MRRHHRPPLGWHNEYAPKPLWYKARYWILWVAWNCQEAFEICRASLKRTA